VTLNTGSIFDIRRYSIHDGPGIRTAVFFKGCPLACAWCHNPEGRLEAPQLIFRPARCILCGDCLEVCPQEAVSRRADEILIDRARCRVSGACAAVCPADALQVVGRVVTVEEVLAEVERDRAFHEQSGGGVTFTGGEPLAQPRFLRDLLSACRTRAIHTVVDTCGYAPWRLLDRLRPLVDLFLYDLKLIDDTRHRQWTGVSNADILSNLRSLSQAGSAVRVRLPLLPGVNDDEQNLGGIGQFLASLPHVPPLQLLPYHDIAAAKYAGLGMEYSLAHLRPPDAARVQECAALLGEYGIQVLA
jgi:pyruvate formate lyase activating enzyme